MRMKQPEELKVKQKQRPSVRRRVCLTVVLGLAALTSFVTNGHSGPYGGNYGG